MNANKQTFLIAVYIAVASAFPVQNNFAQGSLNPPGAPVPGMKTLGQLEPRVDLATLAGNATYNHVISQPGSYYLSGDIVVTNSSGVLINSTDVTLDLNGFNISRASGSSGSGIQIENGMDRAVVRNGSINGFNYGIRHSSSPPAQGCRFDSLVVSGCTSYGMYVGACSLIANCIANNNAGSGIVTLDSSTLSGCIAQNNGGSFGMYVGLGSSVENCTANGNVYGIYVRLGSTLHNCSSRFNTYGIFCEDSVTLRGCSATFNSQTGIHVDSGSTVDNCTASYNLIRGIDALMRCTIKNCTVYNNYYDGIVVESGCNVTGNTCCRNSQASESYSAGIRATSFGNRIEKNNVTDLNYYGIKADYKNNWVSENTVSGNTYNYNFVAGNHLNLLLSEVPETISWPASVKLAGTLICETTTQHAITVNSSDVTIDLNGHTLTGQTNTVFSGIYVSSGKDRVTVRNGSIRGFSYGINSVDSDGCLFQEVVVSGAGSGSSAIYAGGPTRIIDCQAHNNSGNGFQTENGSFLSGCLSMNNAGTGIEVGDDCQLVSCRAQQNSSNGIFANDNVTLRDCTANGNTGEYGIKTRDNSSLLQCSAVGNIGSGTSSYGIYVRRSCSVIDCTSTKNDNTNAATNATQGVGVYMDYWCSIEGCLVSYNSGDGICVKGVCYIRDNTSNFNGNTLTTDGAGIHVLENAAVIDGNMVFNCARGIDLDEGSNFVIRNKVTGNDINYDLFTGNKVGFIVEVPSSGTISGTMGGSGAGSTDPWANFSY